MWCCPQVEAGRWVSPWKRHSPCPRTPWRPSLCHALCNGSSPPGCWQTLPDLPRWTQLSWVAEQSGLAKVAGRTLPQVLAPGGQGLTPGAHCVVAVLPRPRQGKESLPGCCRKEGCKSKACKVGPAQCGHRLHSRDF